MKNILLDRMLRMFTYIDPVHGRSLRFPVVIVIVAACYIIAIILDGAIS